jgi:hypothetical protein
MGAEAGAARNTGEWGPVSRGFLVSLPNGERGFVEHIRSSVGGVELVVATGLFVRRFVTVRANEIEAILPAARRIFVQGSADAVALGTGEPEAAGGIVRFPIGHSLRLGAAPKDAA